MDDKCILALDVGTTGLRAIIFDHNLKEIAKAYRKTPIIMPNPGWVEQDPIMIWEKTQEVIKEVLAKVPAERIAAMGITTQRATFTSWNPATGTPLINFISWQDVRSAEDSIKLTKKFAPIRGIMRFIYFFVRNPFFYTLSKIEITPLLAIVRTMWILDHVPTVSREKAKKREILWGAIDTWLVWKLTGGRVHATDVSNFASTGLANPFTLEWNTTYAKYMKIPREWMPEVKPTNGDFGYTTLFGGQIPIRAVVADQQSSLFGQGCYEKGDAKVTNGTGTFVNMNMGTKPAVSPHGLLPMIAWQLDDANKTTFYMLEANAATCGELVEWLIDGIALAKDPAETDALALSVPDSNNVYMVPAFTGLRFPYWDSYARGALVGLTRDTKKAHVVRAALEGIGFRIQDIVSVLSADTKIPIKRLRIDGGVSRSKFLNQFIADITNARVECGPSTDMTAYGAATLAGLAIGYWKDRSEIKATHEASEVFEPKISEEERKEKIRRWQNAVSRAKGWAVDSKSLRLPKI